MREARTPPSARQAIALFEAVKGLAALAGLIGILDLMHRDVRAVAMTLVGRFGLNPEGHYPSLLLHYADLLPHTDVHLLVTLGAAYVAIRWLEALGLWLNKAWGEFLGAFSGGIYIPFEVTHFMHEPTWVNAVVVALNGAIVAYLLHALWRRQAQKTACNDAPV